MENCTINFGEYSEWEGEEGNEKIDFKLLSWSPTPPVTIVEFEIQKIQAYSGYAEMTLSTGEKVIHDCVETRGGNGADCDIFMKLISKDGFEHKLEMGEDEMDSFWRGTVCKSMFVWYTEFVSK